MTVCTVNRNITMLRMKFNNSFEAEQVFYYHRCRATAVTSL